MLFDTVPHMQRSKGKAVTRRNGLPILVPCKEGEKADGLMTFGADLNPIKIFRDEDYEAAFDGLGIDGQKILSRLHLIRQGIRKDETFEKLRTHAESIFPFGDLHKAFRATIDWSAPGPRVGKVTVSQKALLHGFVCSADPFVALSTMVSASLAEASLVFWWKGKPPKRGWIIGTGIEGKPVREYQREMERRDRGKFMPAIFCLSTKSALYAYLFFGSGSAAICPECQATFKRKRPDQTFCSPAHRDAHRVRRWRKRRRARLTA